MRTQRSFAGVYEVEGRGWGAVRNQGSFAGVYEVEGKGGGAVRTQVRASKLETLKGQFANFTKMMIISFFWVMNQKYRNKQN